MNQKVSVCLPVYNAENYIRKTIDSILRQTYSDFEFVILENGSTDNSLSIIKQYDDPRIKIFTNKETLPSTENWNKCINLASGDLIALFHSDDIYEPNMLEEEVRQFNKYPNLGAVFTRGYTIDENDTVTGEMFMDDPLKKSELIDLNMAFYSYIESGKGSFICPTTMIPKKVYSEIGKYDSAGYRYAFDYDMYFRILERYPIRIINEKLIKYRIHSGQGTKKVVIKHHKPDEMFLLFNKFIKSPALSMELPRSLINSMRKAEKKDYYRCAINALKRNDTAYATEMLGKAVQIDPGIFDMVIKYLSSKNKISWLTSFIERVKG
jgi:glycosyltransferase involved in cell wall biosynthesis